jgi:P27 family predicted phage terminase small subunit
MAGRKPIPTTLKLIRGTARPHRMNKDEPMPPACVPEPPAHLEERARRKFTEIADMLARCGVMTELDRDALGRYCVIWCRWIDAEAEIKRKGSIVKTEAGNIIHSPYLAVANRCHRQLAKARSGVRPDPVQPLAGARLAVASPPRFGGRQVLRLLSGRR